MAISACGCLGGGGGGASMRQTGGDKPNRVLAGVDSVPTIPAHTPKRGVTGSWLVSSFLPDCGGTEARGSFNWSF